MSSRKLEQLKKRYDEVRKTLEQYEYPIYSSIITKRRDGDMDRSIREKDGTGMPIRVGVKRTEKLQLSNVIQELIMKEERKITAEAFRNNKYKSIVKGWR